MNGTPLPPPRRAVNVTVNDRPVTVGAGATVLDACRLAGADVPTLCWGPTLEPKNACRICVVEVEGARALVPACSRAAEAGMEIRTDTDRSRHARKMVLELLASTAEMGRTPAFEEWMSRYGARADRFGPPAPPTAPGERDGAVAGEHHPVDGSTAANLAQPPKVDDDLYVRDYQHCILCYRCVDACGEQWQGTFAITVAGRGFDARISTEWDVELTGSACVYCGNCIAVCPTGALLPRTEFDLRVAGRWDEDGQEQVTTVCPYCGVGCNLVLHVQDERIVKVTSPDDHDITRGNLCIKGRFGWAHVQP